MLYGVWCDKLYKIHPPTTCDNGWIGSATLMGKGGWSVFKFLFFDPHGILYGVENNKFHKRKPPTCATDNWMATSTLIGDGGWSNFTFLFFMHDCERRIGQQVLQGSTPSCEQFILDSELEEYWLWWLVFVSISEFFSIVISRFVTRRSLIPIVEWFKIVNTVLFHWGPLHRQLFQSLYLDL